MFSHAHVETLCKVKLETTESGQVVSERSRGLAKPERLRVLHQEAVFVGDVIHAKNDDVGSRQLTGEPRNVNAPANLSLPQCRMPRTGILH